jgi:hypothetical protein
LLSAAPCAEYGEANLRIFRDSSAEHNFSVKTRNWLADQEGFELAVRSEKFAFELSAEISRLTRQIRLQRKFRG